MTVGVATTSDQINAQLMNLALSLRNICSQIENLNTQVNGGGNGAPVGVAALESYGYSATDAASSENLIGYLHNVAGVYFGTATVGAPFNFNNALAQLWAGQ